MKRDGRNREIFIASDLTTGYHHRGQRRIVSVPLHLSLRCGGVTALIGPNGSGKSTLLRTIAGMQPALSGEMFLQSREYETYSVRERARLISVVLTGRSTPGHIPAGRLVELGRYPHTNVLDRLTERDHRVVAWALKAAGAEELGSRPVDELSDGELQKVMIARALAQEPKMILLDEPTAFLDITRKIELMHLLKTISAEQNTAVLISSHDLELVLRIADTVWLLDEEGGLHEGTTEDKEFSGRMHEVFRIPSAFSLDD